MKLKKALSSLLAVSTCLGLLTTTSTSFMFSSADENNYLSQSKFESSTGDWKSRGEATIELSDENFYEGSKALHISGRSDTWHGAQMALDSSTFKPGETYSFSAAVSAKKAAEIMLSLVYKDGTETAYDHIASYSVSAGKWAILSNAQYTIPAGATDVLLYIETAKGSTDLYLDDVTIGPKGEGTSLPTPGEERGDLDGDKKITVADYSLLKYFVLNQKLSAPVCADIDGDGIIDVKDLTLVKDFMFNKRTEFPKLPDPPPPPEEPEDDFQYTKNMQYRDYPNGYANPCEKKGKIINENYTSCHGNKATYARVYLPYGYDENDTTKKYNIFYLMHGGGENQNTLFSDEYKFNNILDHMIMNGDIDPMIVVTPTFTNGDVTNFYQELIQNLMPLVEGKYHTYAESTSKEDLMASRYHRAFGGFSMGSMCTWNCFLGAVDYIAYFMPLSGESRVGNNAAEMAKKIADGAKNSGYKPDEYFIFCATGSDDIACPNFTPMIEEMKKYKEQFIYSSDLSEGNFYYMVAQGKVHWWTHVLNYVYDILPSFFHEHQAMK